MSVSALDHIELPRVSGRHRNKQLATARKVEAVRLRTQGLTFRQIANRMGYANPGTAYSVIAINLSRILRTRMA